MNKGITVKELLNECKKQIKNGNGDKHILISSDDEGNGFHTLFYGFTDNPEDIRAYEDVFYDNSNPEEIVLLG